MNLSGIVDTILSTRFSQYANVCRQECIHPLSSALSYSQIRIARSRTHKFVSHALFSFLFRQIWPLVAARLGASVGDRCVGEMTGADRALISSLEGFEDLQLIGRLQLAQHGVARGDVVICVTEGMIFTFGGVGLMGGWFDGWLGGWVVGSVGGWVGGGIRWCASHAFAFFSQIAMDAVLRVRLPLMM
jgi:hypothetical protein